MAPPPLGSGRRPHRRRYRARRVRRLSELSRWRLVRRASARAFHRGSLARREYQPDPNGKRPVRRRVSDSTEAPGVVSERYYFWASPWLARLQAFTHVSLKARKAVLLSFLPANSRGNACPATALPLMVALHW